MAITRNNQALLPYQTYSDQANWSNTYLTDPALIKALGPFRLDVACPPVMPWRTAKEMFHEGETNALTENWSKGTRAGKPMWMNPPYRNVMHWVRRFVEHGHGLALLNGRSVETKATQLAMAHASGVFFPHGRLTFYDIKGQPYRDKTGNVGKWLPSVIVGLDEADARKLTALPQRGFPGVFLKGPRHP